MPIPLGDGVSTLPLQARSGHPLFLDLPWEVSIAELAGFPVGVGGCSTTAMTIVGELSARYRCVALDMQRRILAFLHGC